MVLIVHSQAVCLLASSMQSLKSALQLNPAKKIGVKYRTNAAAVFVTRVCLDSSFSMERLLSAISQLRIKNFQVS